MNHCQCQTGVGKQCFRDAKTGSQFCWQHINCQKMVKLSQKKLTSQKKTTKSNQKTAKSSQKNSTSQQKNTPPQPVSQTQQKDVDPEIQQAYEEFIQDYEFNQPILIEDFEQAYNTVKEEWFETMGEYVDIEDYAFDEQQKEQLNSELAYSYPDKYISID